MAEEELTTEQLKENVQDIEKGIDTVGDKIHSFQKTRILIKLAGNGAFLATLLMGLWLHAFLLWLVFFPDSEEIIRFVKGKVYKEKVTT